MKPCDQKRRTCRRKIGANIHYYEILLSFSALFAASVWLQPLCSVRAEEPAASSHFLTAIPGSSVVIDDGFWRQSSRCGAT